MFIFKLTYKKPLAEVEKYLQEHRDYLDQFPRHQTQPLQLHRQPRGYVRTQFSPVNLYLL